MRYANLPLLQVCLVFLLGIWFGFSTLGFDLNFYLISALSLFTVFIISFLASKFFSKLNLFFSIASLLFLFSLGFLNTKIHLPKHQEQHYTNQVLLDSVQNDFITFEGEVIKKLKSSAFKDKFELELSSLKGKKVKGKVLVQVPVTDESKFNSGYKIYGYGKIKAFEESKNPQQFDYKAYMFSQQMLHVIDSDYEQIQVRPFSGFSWISLGEKARNKIESALKRYSFSSNQLELIQALLLGQKQNVDPETYDNFSKAGVVHILAVSGLHVGILLLILQFMTKGLLRIKFGLFIRGVLVLFGIWGFAMLAGFSPSVLRAAVMFSFLSVALNYRRKTSAVNTLALSAVFLLIINPYFIFQVGFQLSYMAVLSIVTMQPRLFKLYQPKYFLDRKIWAIITVTLTAQLGVLPLSLYYFHQFPGLFLLSNLIILPGLGLLLSGGILIILLSLLNILPDFLVSLYGNLLDLLLGFVNWIASKEDLIFSNIYYTLPMLIASIIFLLSLILWDNRQRIRSYFILNLSLVILLCSIYSEKRDQLQQKEFIVFQIYQSSEIGELQGEAFNLFTDKLKNKDSIKASYHLQNYMALKGIDAIQLSAMRNIYEFYSNEFLYVLDSNPVYPEVNFNPDYLLLKDSPDINLDRVLSELKPKQLIADGSNYKTDVDLWRKSAKKYKVMFHSTWENGAFKIKPD